MPFRLILTALLFLLLVPAPAFACPVCGLAGSGETNGAYFVMTIIMSGLPLVMIGGVVFWIYRRSSSDDQ